jgi:peptide/nickel transport system substrate-binding protein
MYASRPGHRGGSLSRRDLLRLGGLGAAALGASAVSGCGTAAIPGAEAGMGTGPARGGRLRVGTVGGSVADTLDAHIPVTHPDQARVINLYDTLMEFDHDYNARPALAEFVESSPDATQYTVRLKRGLEFHNGKTVTAHDVVATLRRIADPDDPKTGATGLASLDLDDMRVLDPRTVRLNMTSPDVTLVDQLAEYYMGVVPEDYDVRRPVGAGPFRLSTFEPGLQSVFTRHTNYWRAPEPYLGELVVIDFPDDNARVNALLGSQVDAIDQLPAALNRVIRSDPSLRVLESETGAWLPFTMRVDIPPFDDQRVREAMRLVVDREQMITQVFSGHGVVANDLYARYDDCYPDHLPQRRQDLERARTLLRAAGQQDLTVELVTSPVASGLVEAAQVFAKQARGAGVTVKVRKVTTGEFYGDNYLLWPFAQDFWFTRNFLPQAGQCSLPSSPYNETHWADPEFVSLVKQAKATIDPARRCQMIQAAQQIEHERGGYIVWAFNNQVDAYNVRLSGLEPDRSGIPLSGYRFRRVSFGA